MQSALENDLTEKDSAQLAFGLRKPSSNEPKYKCKFTVMVRRGVKDFPLEHCVLSFLSDTDRKNFTKVYTE